MFRTIASTGLRASRARSAPLARRQMSAAAPSKKVSQGTDELWPFAKNIPVDVYPLAFLVTVVCSASVFMIGKHLTQDKQLRLKPTGTY